MHDRLREWTRIEQQRQPSPSEAIIENLSVKSAAMVSQEVGFDGGKVIKGRFRFLTVDTLGLVLRVLVTSANVGERAGGQRGHDPYHGEAVGIKVHPSELFKHPLRGVFIFCGFL